MRKAIQMRRQQADPVEHGEDLAAPRRAVQSGPELAQRFFDDLGDAHARVERGERILEDDLQVFPHGAQRRPLEREEIGAAKTRGAGRRRHQTQQRPRDGRFAGA